MKTKLLAVLLSITAIGWLQADQVAIASPDKAQVMVYSNLTHTVLKWDAENRGLTAYITFSNANYVSSVEPRDDQSLTFALPGVKYDSSKRVFYKDDARGNRIPVATMEQSLFAKQIKLAPGAKILALDNHGRISVMLVASRGSVVGPQWVRIQETPELQRIFANARGLHRINRG